MGTGRPPKALSRASEEIENSIATIGSIEDALYDINAMLTDFLISHSKGRLRTGDIKALLHNFGKVVKRVHNARSSAKIANSMLEILRTESKSFFEGEIRALEKRRLEEELTQEKR